MSLNVGDKPLDPMAAQSKEFDAMNQLANAWQRLRRTAVVDDDYPEARHYYESSLTSLLAAMRENRRFGPGNRYKLENVA